MQFLANLTCIRLFFLIPHLCGFLILVAWRFCTSYCISQAEWAGGVGLLHPRPPPDITLGVKPWGQGA